MLCSASVSLLTPFLSKQFRERDKREEKEKHMKSDKESRDYEKERIRQELILKEKEENAKDAVEQHFEESLRLARQKVCTLRPLFSPPFLNLIHLIN